MTSIAADSNVVAEAHRPSIVAVETVKGEDDRAIADDRSDTALNVTEPTMEEMKTLRRVSGKINWQMMTVTFVEFCERFSYYGTTAVFVNFIQQPRPYGSRTGAIQDNAACFRASTQSACLQPGGLGMDQRAATGLTTFNQFWAYVMPLIGGWIADSYLGRFVTIQYAIIAAVLGHTLLVCSSIPSVMDNPHGALGLFAVGLVVLGFGTGGFKSNISPLLAEQIKDTRPEVITLPSGERVIKDPQVTISRIFLYFYMMINLGALSGGIGMVYAERYVGFWLSYAMPTFLFFFAPLVLLVCKKWYVLTPPTGSVLSKAFALLKLACKGSWSPNPARTYKNLTRPGFWEDVKPSRLGNSKPTWMRSVDDAWVEQVARGIGACKVFLWLPLYWLAYNQMSNNLTSQAAVMQLNGVPNDLINNLNPISLVIFIPIMDAFVYPALRKARINFTPIKRITFGFFIASAAMIAATVTQYYIYRTSACPKAHVNEGVWPDANGDDVSCIAPINVWVQAVPYVLIGFSEILASITGLEYAFSKAPENMRGVVMGVNLLQTAFSSALGQALLPLADDPLLTWNYAISAILAFLGGVGFWFTWRSLDAKEDELNMIEHTKYIGRKASWTDVEKEEATSTTFR